MTNIIINQALLSRASISILLDTTDLRKILGEACLRTIFGSGHQISHVWFNKPRWPNKLIQDLLHKRLYK